MKALITGASSGIGLDMAKYLATKKCELILVARNKEKLEELQEKLSTKVTIIVADLSNEQKVKELYAFAKKENVDVLINNAGLGDFGYLTEGEKEELYTELTKEGFIKENISLVCPERKLEYGEMFEFELTYKLNLEYAIGLSERKHETKEILLHVKKYGYSKI